LFQFFKRISDVFEHTVQVKKHLIPKIGDQAFVLASNDFDFLDRNLTDHNLKNNIYMEPLSPDYDRFELVHDYRNNPNNSFKRLCKAEDEEDEVFEQEGSPGIFMAVEAEEVTTADIGSIKDVQDAVTNALEGEGLKVDSVAQRTEATGFPNSASGEIFLVLREGYVAIRTWPQHKYCAFDIHLWSAFEKHEAAKKAVIASVGGKMAAASAYRIVAGGMFGVSTWKEDAKGHGPQIHKICDPSEAPVRDAPTEPSTAKLALDTGLSLVHDDNIVAAVVCEDKEACPTIELLKKNAKVSKVIILSACPDVTPTDEYSEEGRKRIVECEKGILKTIQDSVTDEKRLRAIVLDTGAKPLMGQILLRILSKKSDAVDILDSDIIALATIEDQGAESWRRSFLDLFGKQVVTLDPVFRAEVMFNSTESSVELGISSSGDKLFMQLLVDTTTSVEKESGLAVEIREIHGGLWRPEPKRLMLDEDAEKLFSWESYDRTSPLEQWRSQQPLGHQTLFQLETRPLRRGDAVEVTDLDGKNMGVVHQVHPDGKYRIRFHDGDVEDEVQRGDIRKVHGSPNTEIPPANYVKDAIKKAFSSMSSMEIKVQDMTSTGDGCVMVAFWEQGSAIVVWDGRIHIDVNLITYFQNKKIPKELLAKMTSNLLSLELILHDEQPRGFGRVVNFQKNDAVSGARKLKDPLWA
jgi:S-adenosylmethionine/arginine decarboxylase-like enzyme